LLLTNTPDFYHYCIYEVRCVIVVLSTLNDHIDIMKRRDNI